MRLRTGALLAMAAALAVSACTSSGGAKIGQQSSGRKPGGGWFEARPLIMPGQRVTTVRPDPFGALSVPSTEAAYERLSPARQAGLVTALRGVDCAHPPHLPRSADRVVCDADSDAFLLGAALFTGGDVTRARALAPTAGVVDWQVSLSLDSTASDAMYGWTSRHHVTARSGAFNDVQTSATPPCGHFQAAPCADFTAFIGDGRVLSVPVSFAPVRNTIVLDGAFDQAFAGRLATRLTG